MSRVAHNHRHPQGMARTTWSRSLKGVSPTDCHCALVILGSSMLILAAASGYTFDLLDWPGLAAGMILVLGVPHGACDIAIIQRRWRRVDRFNLITVLASYIGLVLIVISAWLVFPGLSLAIFLLVSSYHFGGDWLIFRSRGARMVAGSAILSATALLHEAQVRDIFARLASPEAAATLSFAMHQAAIPLCVLAGVLVLRVQRQWIGEATEYALLSLCAVVLPPITFFVVYFCLVHSVRHAIDARQELRHIPTRKLLVRVAPYAIVAVCGTTTTGILMMRTGIDTELLSVVFVALASLTVPHMVLVDKHTRLS
jgi:beta-carotene 15,15'-dioxygenase